MGVYVPLSVIIATIISCGGSMFTLLTYFLFPELRNPSQVFAIWLAIGSLGFSLFTFLPMIYRNHIACKVYGATSTYFTLISLFSTVVVADCMRKIFLRYGSQSQEPAVVQVSKEYYIFVFLFPLTFVWLPATTNSFGINDHDIFCWIKIDSSNELHNDIGFMWILLTFYIPYFCGICFNTYVYANVFYWVSVWKNQQSLETNRLMAVVDRIKWYPIILIACYTLPLIHRGMEMSSHEFHHHRMIVIWSSVTLKLQGFFDALAYSATPQVLRKWQIFLTDSLVPTFEWSNTNTNSHQSSSLIGGMFLSTDTSKASVPIGNKNRAAPPISSNSNSNSKGSSYFSYAQEESGAF